VRALNPVGAVPGQTPAGFVLAQTVLGVGLQARRGEFRWEHVPVDAGLGGSVLTGQAGNLSIIQLILHALQGLCRFPGCSVLLVLEGIQERWSPSPKPRSHLECPSCAEACLRVFVCRRNFKR
jgi:hypothetical protein